MVILVEYMKLISSILFIIIPTFSYAENIKLGYFTAKDISGGQSGCWYYHPADKQRSGNVIGLGESADDAIYLLINGEKKMIGNWKADYQKEQHIITYSSPVYSVEIHSRILGESQYSSQYESTLAVTTKTGKTVVEVFSECGS